MTQAPYPPIVRLKKLALILAFISAGLIATVIFYNLSMATNAPKSHTQNAKNTIQSVANESDTTWYKSKITPAEIPVARTVMSDSSKIASTPANTTLSTADPDTLKAMSAPIHSNQMVAESATANISNAETTAKEGTISTLKNPSSPYVIQPGTFIPALLITGINSDLPGQIIAQVRENVYDSVSGQYLLIPQGSKLIGVYDAKIIYGQERVLVAWQHLLLPNGQSIDLPDMAGVDNSGYAGLTDQVNAHYGKLLSAAALTSVLGAGAQWLQPQLHTGLSENNPTITASLTQNAGASLIQTASELTHKNLNIQPTLEIRPGYLFNVAVTKALVFKKAYDDVDEVN